MFQDLRYALRTLAKSPGFTTVAVLTLALGIGATTAIFSVINGVLLRPLPYPEPDRLIALFMRGSELRARALSYPDAQEIGGLTRDFSGVAPYTTQSYNFTGGSEPREVRAAQASDALFRVLGAEALVGRTFGPGELREQVAVLSHRLWANEFGSDRGVIGRTIALDARLFTVIGVMPPGFHFPDDDTQLWVPLGQAFAASPQAEHDRNMSVFNTVARLTPAATPEQVSADLAVVARRINARGLGTETQFLAPPLLEEILQDGVAPRTLWVLLGAVGLVLLIACANVAALLLARGTARRREIAVRLAMGAGRWRMVRQMLTESIVLAVAAGGIGSIVGYWAVAALPVLWPDVLARPEEITLDARVLGFALALSVLTGLVFGLVPALRVSAIGVEQTLRDESGASTGSRRRGRINGALVAAEVAVALVLLVGSGLLVRSFLRLTSVELGYDTREVLAARIRLTPARYAELPAQREFFDRLTTQLAQHQGVADVSLSGTLPLTGGVNILAFDARRVRPDYPKPYLASRPTVVAPGYFATAGIRLRAGRDFTAADRADAPPVAIVNTQLANLLWPGQDPLGKAMPVKLPGIGAVTLSVIGVIGDVRYASLDAAVMPEIYLPYLQAHRVPEMWVMVRATGAPLRLAGALRDAVRQIDPEQPIAEIVSLEQMAVRSTATRRFNMTLLGTFAGLALVLALVGIYGVTAYGVTQRTREMGLRMAIGAGPIDLIRMLLAENLRVVLVGLAAGLLGAAAVTRVLRAMLFEVSTTDAPTFAAAAVLLALAALAATYVPARRAARVDPMVALRYE